MTNENFESTSPPKRAIYALSGDPITYGHIDIIKRAQRIFDKLTVAIGFNPAKKYLFTMEERKQLAQDALRAVPGIEIVIFRGLLIDFAYENNFTTVVRGIRNSEDLHYELTLYHVGNSQRVDIDTIYLPARQELSHVSSGAVKALQVEQGLIHEYVPLNVKKSLEVRLSGQYMLGITGEIGSGKSYVADQFQELGQQQGLEVHIIDIDKIGHQILGELNEALYQEVRREIAEKFGLDLLDQQGYINRKALGKIIFNSTQKLDVFNALLYQPLILKLRREIYGKKGLIILHTALIAESQMGYLCNNHVLLVEVSPEVQLKRLAERGYTEAQIDSRIRSQFNASLKEKMIRQSIVKDNQGKVWKVENSDLGNTQNVREMFREIVGYLGVK